MAKYIHPILHRGRETCTNAGIVLTQISPDSDPFLLKQGSTRDRMEMMTLEQFRRRMQVDREIREGLGIPVRFYHAYSFAIPVVTDEVIRLIEHARKNPEWEVRMWVNEESGRLLVVVSDPDTSEDSGWDLFQFVDREITSKDSYGLSSWYEFCLFGIPIFDGWKVEARNGNIVALSPDGKQIAYAGM